MSLVEQFFERDLSEAEADQLEALLLSSPEAAEQMLGLAERDYRASGLPTPVRGERGPSKKRFIWILGACLAVAAGGFWLAQGEAPSYQLAQEEASAFSEGELAAESAPVRPVRVEPETARAPAPEAQVQARGKRYGLQVDGAEAGQLKVLVFNGQGRCVRHVYDGPLAEGWHKLAWDGRLDDGRKAAAGRYVIEVHSSAGVSRQEIKL